VRDVSDGFFFDLTVFTVGSSEQMRVIHPFANVTRCSDHVNGMRSFSSPHICDDCITDEIQKSIY
jgi:hypothetical protein